MRVSGEHEAPPSSTLTDGNNAQKRYGGDCAPGQGTRDAPEGGSRENDDDGQDRQIEAAKR